MPTVLGINAVFHDPAAALVVDGCTVAAAEEERYSRRKHGKQAVPFSTWELPERAVRWCLAEAGVQAADLDAVTYSYDPRLAPPGGGGDITADAWEGLRTLYAERADRFLAALLAGLDPAAVRYVPHHVAHAASAYLAAPGYDDCAVLTLDGRGEQQTGILGRVRGGELEVLAETRLPHSLGLLYEELTVHLGFTRSSDEYKVMAMASYGEPRWIETLREEVHVTGHGSVICPSDLDLGRFCPPWTPSDEISRDHADLAATVQARLEEVLLDLARWLHARTGDTRLAMAGGTALNCVANSRLWREGPFDEIWVQPAAGDAGTALGGALYVARELGDRLRPFTTAALGSGFDDEDIELALQHARVPYERPTDLADTGTRSEHDLAARIVSLAGLPADTNLAGQLDLGALARTVAGAARVVCGDTGVAHLATAYGTPSVVLFGPTPPSAWGPPLERRDRHRPLWAGRRGDAHGARIDAGLLALSPSEVVAALEQLPARAPSAVD